MSKLSPIQQQLIDKLLRAPVAAPDGQRIARVPAGSRVPLSPAQARIWFFSRLYPESVEYNVFESLHLETAPERARLEAAVRALMERHDALRLRVTEIDGEPAQEDCGPLAPPLELHDLTGLSPAEATERAHQLGSAAARVPFQPDQPPLFRIVACHLPDDSAALVFVAHHLIVDYWSLTLLFGELSELIAGRELPGRAPVRFIDHVAWERATTDPARLAQQLDYWMVKLGGELPILDLPKDRPRPARPSRLGRAVSVTIPANLAVALRRIAEKERTTLFVVLLAAYKSLLLRLTNQTDVIVGTALSGREDAITEQIVGCFVKTVALRTELDGPVSFREVIRRVHTTVMEAQDHQLAPYEQIVARLAVSRDLSVSPVFQTYLGLQSATTLRMVEGRVDTTLLDVAAAKWDLTVSFTDDGAELDGFVEGASDLFDEKTVARFAGMYLRLLSALAADAARPIRAHPLMAAQERARILTGLNHYQRPRHPYRTLAEPFEEQAARTPDAIALIGERETVTYGELNARANRLAAFLRAAGAARGTLIAVAAERSPELVVALYAIAKAGAAYVPLDPELPDGRIAFMLADTTPALVLVDGGAAARIPAGPWQAVRIDDEPSPWADQSPADVACAGAAGQLSHLLYTSGSTGRPKAVACAAEGAIADILWMQRSYPYQPGDTTIFKTSFGFDVSLWEIFWPLYFGARLLICRPGGHRDARHLVELIERHAVTTLYLIPTMLHVFLDEMPAGSCRSLRWMLSGGEPVTPRLRDAFYARLGARLINGYGPTETGCATDTVIPPEPGCPVVPLGRPHANFRIYILDEEMEVVPLGVPGEAFIAAEVGIAHGYFRRPELTAERFLPDPFGPPGSRMYQTGDICRYRNDGVLEHLGRIGRQVKVRGMRIELAEIEAVLCEHPRVRECVALAATHAGDKHLIAFVLCVPGAPPELRELIAHAARLLPSFMIPAIQLVDDIPMNVNNKTDHAALLERWDWGDEGGAGREIVPPADAQEERLAAIFARVLGRARLGVTENFFALGGHSLLVIKLIAACAKELHLRLGVADVFAAPTVRELATRLASSRSDPGLSLVPLLPRPERPLVVFIHAASGSALPFYEVARHLGERFASYALQAPEDEGNRSDAIEHLAALYLAAVERVREGRPLLLAGWSMGGCVALEMARQGQRLGIATVATVMLDSWPPPTVLPSAAAQAEERRRILEMDVLREEGIDVSVAGEATAELERLRRVIDRNRRAYLEYAPSFFDGEVHLLRARERTAASRPLLAGDAPPADHGWGALVRTVSARDVPGNHFTLLASEHAPSLAAALEEIAAAALGGHDRGGAE